MIRIVVDCLGGDYCPEACIQGSIQVLELFPDLQIILTGDEETLKNGLRAEGYSGDRISVVHAPEVVSGEEKPTDAIRLKKNSSMMTGIRLLREDDSICGMVSTGSTGALVAASIFRIGRVPGIIRPVFCPVLPTMDGNLVGVCDSGANVDIASDMLPQFAIMGSLYLETVFDVREPKVALLNIGMETEKGDNLRREAYPLLEKLKGIRFVGNMESRDFLSGKYNLIVCDGFSGNVLLKATEGTALELLKKIKKDIYSRKLYQFGALFMRKMFREEKEFMNYQNYGGSVLLGCSKLIVKGHGNSNAAAVKKCIEQVYRMEAGAYNEKLEKRINEINGD